MADLTVAEAAGWQIIDSLDPEIRDQLLELIDKR